MLKYFTFFIFLVANVQNIMTLETSADPRIIPITTIQPYETKIYPLAIIGAGAAGTMAVQRGILNNTELLLFTGAKQELRNSRGTWVRKVDNVPSLAKYKRTILELRNETLLELTKNPLSSNLYVIEDSIISIEKATDFFKLSDRSGRIYYAKHVVLATGIMDEQPLIQGTIRSILKYANAQTVAYCPICDGHRSFGKRTAIIGFSNSAANTALQLADRYQLKNVAILTNGHPPEFSPEIFTELQAKNIKVYQAPILEIFGDREIGQLSGFKLESEENIDAEMAFILLGIRPNNQLALQLGAKTDERGLVIADSKGETSVPNLFVIGDLRAKSMKQIYIAWEHAVVAIQTISKRLK